MTDEAPSDIFQSSINILAEVKEEAEKKLKEIGEEVKEKIEENKEKIEENIPKPPPMHTRNKLGKPITEAEKLADVNKAGKTTIMRETLVCLRRILRNLDILVLLMVIGFTAWTAKLVMTQNNFYAFLTGLITAVLSVLKLGMSKGTFADKLYFEITKKNIGNDGRTLQGK